MGDVRLYLFLACIGQIVYPHTCIGKGKSTYNLARICIQFVAITLSQQLFCVVKTIAGKEIVEVLVTTGETNHVIWVCQIKD